MQRPVSADILRAARGMARVHASGLTPQDRSALAYLAVYACGYSGRSTLDRFLPLRSAIQDTWFVTRLLTSVPDLVPEEGWTVTDVDGSRVLLQRDGIKTHVDRTRVEPCRPGELVTIQCAALRPGHSPGFVVRYGTTPMPGTQLSRIYLNLQPRSAWWALGPLVRSFDVQRRPVHVKALAHPVSYLRRDACVAYVPTANLAESVALIQASIREHRIVLNQPSPLLTARLQPGLSTATDPPQLDGTFLSYGQWVAGLFLQAADADSRPLGIAGGVMALLREQLPNAEELIGTRSR